MAKWVSLEPWRRALATTVLEARRLVLRRLGASEAGGAGRAWGGGGLCLAGPVPWGRPARRAKSAKGLEEMVEAAFRGSRSAVSPRKGQGAQGRLGGQEER